MIDPRLYMTAGGVRVTRRVAQLPFGTALDDVLDALDRRRGALFGSSYEYPGRYKRWSLGFIDPPLELTSRGDRFRLQALNPRGRVLLAALAGALEQHPHVAGLVRSGDGVTGRVVADAGPVDESLRTRRPSVFSVLRASVEVMASPEDPHLGLYGAFGYDLVFQLEPMPLLRPRPDDQRDLVLYIPDALVVVDHQRQQAVRIDYDFAYQGLDTDGLPRTGAEAMPRRDNRPRERFSDLAPGGYADLVRRTLPWFGRGDLFEAVPGQSYHLPCDAAPSALFRTLRRINPSPYGFLINLGGEHLIGASPEMYVRVEGRRVETCPISGTIRRGKDAIEDAEAIRTLLNSAKDEAELTMCTDVDRNDKSRVCEPGTVRVIGRRQIEVYSHLIHTVDHVEGELADGYDALDAFLTHAWAVTVTGAPKRAAIAYVEQAESSVRRWYGGAVGLVGFNGDLNTGLTLRTMRLADGMAEIRVGATLLADSVPEDEEQEILTKAAALFRTIEVAGSAAGQAAQPDTAAAQGRGRPSRLLLIDHEDSFVHTLASYFRSTGAAVTVLRQPAAAAALAEGEWDLVLLSPGPGRPEQFAVPASVRTAMARALPVFGVCLGLQGMVEALGGRLGTLPEPQHGKQAEIRVRRPSRLFDGLPERFTVGRYHSLHAVEVPPALRVTATTADGIVMAVEHETLPLAAVQFHPESIMTVPGRLLVQAVVERLARA